MNRGLIAQLRRIFTAPPTKQERARLERVKRKIEDRIKQERR